MNSFKVLIALMAMFLLSQAGVLNGKEFSNQENGGNACVGTGCGTVNPKDNELRTGAGALADRRAGFLLIQALRRRQG